MGDPSIGDVNKGIVLPPYTKVQFDREVFRSWFLKKNQTYTGKTFPDAVRHRDKGTKPLPPEGPGPLIHDEDISCFFA